MDVALQIELDKLIETPWETLTKAQRRRYQELCEMWDDAHRVDHSNAGCLLHAPEPTWDAAW